LIQPDIVERNRKLGLSTDQFKLGGASVIDWPVMKWFHRTTG